MHSDRSTVEVFGDPQVELCLKNWLIGKLLLEEIDVSGNILNIGEQ